MRRNRRLGGHGICPEPAHGGKSSDSLRINREEATQRTRWAVYEDQSKKIRMCREVYK